MILDLSLYLVTDPSAKNGVVETAVSAAKNSASLIQLRDKDASDQALITQAKTLKQALAPYNVPLIINDRLTVARAAGADGLHLGQDDGDLMAARQQLGGRAILGLSIEHQDQLKPGLEDILDYFGVGPIFATTTKPCHAPPIGWAGLGQIVAQAQKPCVAIGGLKPGHAQAVKQCGAQGMAVVSAICGSDDPGQATQQLRAEWEAAEP
ncbi:MAG: thiamine phosphate synthase [Pseudomonadota bacterium]